MRNGTFREDRRTVADDSRLFKNPYRAVLATTTDEDFVELRKARTIRRVAEHWIINQSKPTLRQLIEKLEETFGAKEREFVKGCLKCSIGVGAITLDGETTPALDRLKVDVSESALDRERAAAYAAAFGDEWKHKRGVLAF